MSGAGDTLAEPPTRTVLKPDSTIRYWIVRPDVFNELELAWRLEPTYRATIAQQDTLLDSLWQITLQADSLITRLDSLRRQRTIELNQALRATHRKNWWERNDQWIVMGVTAIVTYAIVNSIFRTASR